MDLLLSIVSFLWTKNTFDLLGDSLKQLAVVDLPTIAITSTPHIEAAHDQISLLKKNMSQFGEINRGDKKKALIALTFDDGFEPAESLDMLNTLKEKHVSSTFFLKGNWIIDHQDIVDRIIADGHELGNHSYNHPHFDKISLSTAINEVEDQENILIKQNHYSPKPYFRFPYGARTPQNLLMIKERGYISVLWDIDTLDWAKDSAYVQKEALTKAHNGAIVLMHLGKASSAKALPAIIDGLRQKGYKLVTITDLLNQDDNIPTK